MSIHDYTGLTFEQIEAREAFLQRHDLLPRPGQGPRELSAFIAGETEAAHTSPVFMDAEAPAEGPAAKSVADTNSGAAPTGRDPDTGRFAPGWTGRPKGALNNSTLLARALLDSEAEHLVRHLIALAVSGDSLALRVATTRLLPVHVDLPEVTTAKGAMLAAARVTALVAAGQLTPSDGIKLANLIEVQRRTIETHDLEQRLARIEAMEVVEVDEPDPAEPSGLPQVMRRHDSFASLRAGNARSRKG